MLSLDRLALGEDGRLVLDDSELAALAMDADLTMAGGDLNPANCSNNSCAGSTNNSQCTNGSCSGSSNYKCNNGPVITRP
jgi:hypothetical protein